MKRNLYRILAVLLLTVFVASPVSAVLASDYESKLDKVKKDYEKQINDAKNAYDKQLEEARARKQELEESKKRSEELLAEYGREKESIEAYISELDLRLNDIMLTIFELKEKISATEDDLKTAVEDLTAAEKQRDEQYATMKARVKYIYENGETTYLDVILNAGSIADILNQLEYVSSIQAYDNALLERYAKTCEIVEDRKAVLEATLDNLSTMQEQEELEQQTVQGLYDLKAAEIEKLCEKMDIEDELLFTYIGQITGQEEEIDSILEAEEQRVAELESKRKAEEEKLREEEEKRRLAEQRAAEHQKTNTTNKVYDPDAINYIVLTEETDPYEMIWPLPGDHRTYSKFGPRKAPTKGASTYHQGWDIGGEFGAPIVSVLAGKVIAATYSSSAGNYVKVEHQDGFVTAYLHMSKILVSVGDHVKQGTTLGLCGSTGVSTGPHLHFGVQINGTYVDPNPYIGHLE